MAKFSGVVGFVSASESETSPGVYEDVVTEVTYIGDVLGNYRRWEDSEPKVTPDLNVTNRFSIVADSFAIENTGDMRYITAYGSRWRISSVEILWPRIIISVSGIYNGPIYKAPDNDEEV